MNEVNSLICPKCRGNTTTSLSLPPRILLPARFFPWMLILNKPVGADPSSCARIRQNTGLLPVISVLTADLPLGIDLSERHGNGPFPYLGV